MELKLTSSELELKLTSEPRRHLGTPKYENIFSRYPQAMVNILVLLMGAHIFAYNIENGLGTALIIPHVQVIMFTELTKVPNLTQTSPEF